MRTISYTAVALLVVAGNVRAEISPGEADRLSQAAAVARDTRPLIPDADWNRARCVAVVPSLRKVGGENGRGVMSCRSGDGWSAPVFLQLSRGSWSSQAGAEEVAFVMLVMNEDGVQKLLRDSIAFGADAPEILTYPRAKGLSVGVDLSGSVLRADAAPNRAAYGPGATPSTILATRSLSAPTQASAFLQALQSPATTIAAAAAEPTPPAAPTANLAGPAGPQAPVRSSSTPPGADSDLRTMIVAMQQSIDTMLTSESAAAVGTSGQPGTGGLMVGVSRERLQQLRKQLDTLLAALNARGQ
jgi:SH3 domain-containing YSC84-like protein 1